MREKTHPAVYGFVLCSLGALTACSGSGFADENAEGTVSEAGAESSEALVARPGVRLTLNDAVLTRLKARAVAGEAAWQALKTQCDGYANGTMNPPSGSAYPNFPNVGQGYQGEEYLPVARTLGLCYRVTPDATAQARYGAAGVRLLEAMSTPVGSGGQSPATDAGYGIRNYVVGMAIGYDWLYPALPASTKTRVIASINTWIDWYDQSGFINNDPIGNYFAGYFLAKTTAALATNGDNAKAPAYWDDVVNRMWGKLVKPQFSSMMAGGGWPEGWGYGKKAVLSMVEALWATKTATGLDWWSELPLARDEGKYAMHFAWPALKHLDDQGTIRAGTNLRPSAELYTGLATMLEANADSSAAPLRAFAADVITKAGDDRANWAKFLYGDPNATKSAYTGTAASYFAAGPGHVGMRSGWDAAATWGAFSAGPYINASYSGEQLFDAGSLSVVVGDQPVLINATGFLPQNGGTAGEDLVYDDSWGKHERRLYNTFFVNDSNNPYNPGQNSAPPSSSKAHVDAYEERPAFVYARGAGLGDQYGSSGSRPVTQFTRDLVYVRPGSFVLFDRTNVAQASADQWMSFHTPVAGTSVATADSTQRRFDVKVGGTAVGSIRTLLPKSARTTQVSLPASASRLEVHAPAAGAAQQWLTVVNTGAPGEQTRLSQADGNVASANMVGVELLAPQSQVVLFASDQAATGSVTSADYTVSQNNATHVLVGVTPGAYSVVATVTGGKLHVVVTAGGAMQASASKTLSFSVSSSGAVTAAAAPTPTANPTPIPTPTPTPTPVPTPTGSQQTLSFTQGVNGYTGTTDVSIASLGYSASNPLGTVYKNSDQLYVYALDYTTKGLIRFDVSQVPATASVVSAKLDLTFESWVGSQSVAGDFLKTPWNAGSSSLGWTSGGAGVNWSTPGIGAADFTGTGFKLGGIDASGYQRKSVPLDAASVQSWVKSAASNNGLLLANQDVSKVLRIYSSKAADVAKRPTLTIVYQ